MICAGCDAEDAVDPCSTCGESPLVGGRYRLEARLGTGASGATWRAVRVSDGVTFAIKERPMHDPALAELAKREARVLAELHHDAIPPFVEELATGAGKARRSWLVESFIPGRTLADESLARRYTDEDVLDILDEILAVLEYLHALRPPVLHRDLKPANVIRGDDGRLYLVDFGSVRDHSVGALGGKTVTGTFGYMAPECFAGDASERSDLYGVAALGIALLTRRDPATLHTADGRFDWRAHVSSRRGVVDLLAAMTETDPSRRPSSASNARARIAVLQGALSPPVAALPPPPDRAPRTLEVTREEDLLELEVPNFPAKIHAPMHLTRRTPADDVRRGSLIALAMLVAAGLFAFNFFAEAITLPLPDPDAGRIVEGANVTALAQDPDMQVCALAYRQTHAGHAKDPLIVSVKFKDADTVESTWTYWKGPPYGMFYVESTQNPCFFSAAGAADLPNLIETGRYYMVPFPPP